MELKITASLKSPHFVRLFIYLLVVFAVFLQHAKASPDSQWEEILLMEKGPKEAAKNRKEATANLHAHLQKHLRLLEAFIAGNPSDTRQFQARLRQAALIASIGTLEGDTQGLTRAYRLLTELEQTRNISPEQAADAAFQRVSVLFLQARGQEERMRENIINAAKNFHNKYSTDRRGPRLLVEAASICDNFPLIKRELLETANRSTQEESLKSRIQDSLKQIDLIGQAISFQMPTLQGGNFDLKKELGKIVLLVFWSADSPQSLFWLQTFLPKVAPLNPKNVAIALISVDTHRDQVKQLSKELDIRYPICFDGKGWESPVVRDLGVNAIPAVWIIDQQGRLRTTAARTNFIDAVHRLQKK